MKKLMLCLILTVCALAFTPARVSAEEQPKIAVYVAGGENPRENRVIGTLILDALIRSGRYVAIERANEFMEQVDTEQAKQRSGAVDESEIRRLGTQAGVQFVCVVNRECAFNSCLLSARIIDVETARVAAIGTAENKGMGSMSEIRKAANEIVEIMLGQRLPKGVKETKPKPAAAADPKPVAAADPKPVADADPQPAAAADPQPATDADPKPAADTELKSVADTRPQSIADPKPEGAIDAKPAADAELKSAADTRPKSMADPKAQPAVDPKSKPVADKKPKPAADAEYDYAAGLRYGFGFSNGKDVQIPEAWLRVNKGKTTSLYMGFGWSAGSAPIAMKDSISGADMGLEYRALEFQAAAFYEWRGGSGSLGWYAGPGAMLGNYNYGYYKGKDHLSSETANAFHFGAQGGAELRLQRFKIYADARPTFYCVLYSDLGYEGPGGVLAAGTGFMFTAGAGLGYSF